MTAKAGLLLVSLLAFPAPAQEDAQKPSNVVSVDEIQLRQYEPRHVDAQALYDLAVTTLGRRLIVEERGLTGPVSNISLLGERLVLYDEPNYVNNVLESLSELDQPYERKDVAPTTVVTVEYAPRYITLNAAYDALQPFKRSAQVAWPNQVIRSNISDVVERNLLVLRDTPAVIEDMQTLLERIDKPEPQAILTCYLLKAGEQSDTAGLPQDLMKNLQALVPQFKFRSAGFAMLRTSIAPGRRVQLRIDGEEDDGFHLSFQPTAYDPTSTVLTAANCELMRDHYEHAGGASQYAGQRQVFSTTTVFRGGEYTVLGATGAEPIFLVVRLNPVGG